MRHAAGSWSRINVGIGCHHLPMLPAHRDPEHGHRDQPLDHLLRAHRGQPPGHRDLDPGRCRNDRPRRRGMHLKDDLMRGHWDRAHNGHRDHPRDHRDDDRDHHQRRGIHPPKGGPMRGMCPYLKSPAKRARRPQRSVAMMWPD